MEQHELENLYSKRLRPALTTFTEGVAERVSRLARRGVLLAPFGILASYMLYQRFPENNLVFLPAGLVFGYLLASYFRLRRGYRDHFKRDVIAPIIEAIHPSLGYVPDGSIARSEFEASALFGRTPDTFHGEDLVRGRFAESALRFSEVEAGCRGRSAGEAGRHVLFRGFFIVADLPRTFDGTTVVLPDATEPLLGHIAHTLCTVDAPAGDLIELEHAEFERLYRVHSDDPVEARALLSPSLIECILRFRRRTGQTLCLSFANSRVYIAIPSQRDRFEPLEMISIQNVDRLPRVERMLRDNLQAYIDDLQLGMDVVHVLSLHRDAADPG